MSQNEITIEQAQQRLQELNFLVSHHDSLSKLYLREGITLEQSIAQAQANLKAQTEAPPVKEGRPPVEKELVAKVEKAIELVEAKESK